ncbi:hypothetical protein D3C72_2266810 [compost metagenome]
MRDAALQRDGFVLVAAGRLAAAGRVAAFAVLHHFGGALERGHLAHAGHVAAVPFHAELEVLVRIEALRIDGELRHGDLLVTVVGESRAGGGPERRRAQA